MGLLSLSGANLVVYCGCPVFVVMYWPGAAAAALAGVDAADSRAAMTLASAACRRGAAASRPREWPLVLAWAPAVWAPDLQLAAAVHVAIQVFSACYRCGSRMHSCAKNSGFEEGHPQSIGP